MAAISKPSDSDIALFRQTVGPVKPVTARRPPPPCRKAEPIPLQKRLDEQRVMQALLEAPDEWYELETGEEISYLAAGVRAGLLRRLRRGELSVQAQLDLHGMTVAVAKSALSEFLRQARNSGLRCVLIIHGKGNRSYQKRPVLKGKLNLWLQQREEILAFCSARPVDGSTGAVYVLLRHR
ncbi:MAG: Smr/MutS family protein [Gammaproteobacteria bacterium]